MIQIETASHGPFFNQAFEDYVFRTWREGDVLLTDLWFELMARRERGSADEESIAWARENLRPPRDLDFRMS